LTLVIVPAVFTVFDDIERWASPLAARLLAAKTVQDAPGARARPAVTSTRV
jgi:hypothetical protein